MSSEEFFLRWNDFESKISCAFRELREDKDFFDVTLACDEDQVQVHKVMLSAFSNFFKSLLRRNPHNHPLLYLKGVKYSDLLCVLNFMYHGGVNVAQEDLNSFLAVAEDLQVKGLTQGPSSAGSRESQASLDQKPPSRPRPPPQNAPVKKVQPVPPQVVPPVDDDVQEVAAPMVKVEPVHPQDQGAGNQQQQQGQYNEGVLQLLQYEQGEYDESGYQENSGYVGGSGYGGNMMEATATHKDHLCCYECDKTFKAVSSYRRHIRDYHGDENTQHQCEYCEKVFRTKGILINHKSAEHRQETQAMYIMNQP